MTQEHPITLPPELVQQWRAAASNVPATLSTDSGGRLDYIDFIATRAAQWGADQELKACCEWMADETPTNYINALRAARRSKPPSLKELALALIDGCNDPDNDHLDDDALVLIRRALEQLDD